MPFYAAEYTGHHWAVYDQNKFYSFDDGDATAGEIRPPSSASVTKAQLALVPFSITMHCIMVGSFCFHISSLHILGTLLLHIEGAAMQQVVTRMEKTEHAWAIGV